MIPFVERYHQQFAGVCQQTMDTMISSMQGKLTRRPVPVTTPVYPDGGGREIAAAEEETRRT